MTTFKFELVSPERLLLSEDVEQVVVPGSEGDFTVLAGHAPVLSTLRPGVMDVKLPGGKAKRLYVKAGFAEVDPESLTVLAQRRSTSTRSTPTGSPSRSRTPKRIWPTPRRMPHG